MQVLYTAEAQATGDGRDGRVRTSDGAFEAALAMPKEMGGAGGATNPEQLFAAGYAACFHSALRLVARRARVDAPDSTVTARVGIGSDGNGGFGLTVALAVELPGVPKATAEDLVAQAHQVCPYSNAVRGNVDVTLSITEAK
ncbi:organic hydroperoxide resistance protein [Micromonospora sp. NPDC049679]|uniref:organic hydroperoxide resistance protein n=1 Tax=Micromonospora sp. NPDC049679 TaxID=3155920 RepID=UPI0033E2551D